MYKCSNKLKTNLRRAPFIPSSLRVHLIQEAHGLPLRQLCFPSRSQTHRTVLPPHSRGVRITETQKRINRSQEVLMNICTIRIKLCKNSLMSFSSSSSHSLQPYSVIFCNQEGRMHFFVGVIILFETHGGVFRHDNIGKPISC